MTEHATWVGPLGGMAPLPCLAGLSVTPSRESTQRVGLSGRVREYRTVATRRSWSCNLTAKIDELAILAEVEATMAGPLWMVTHPAQISNVLTPAASVLEGWTYSLGVTSSPAGPNPTIDGMAGASRVISPDASGSQATSPMAPVVPGQPVTVSVYARGGTAGTLRLQWVDPSTGVATNAMSVPIPATTGPLPRYSLSLPAVPAGRSACRIRVDGAVLLARPAITWTTAEQPWAHGQGADKAVLSPLSLDHLHAVEGGNYAAGSYTVQELG